MSYPYSCCSHASARCDRCEAKAVEEKIYTPPNPYEPHLAKIRGFETFEQRYKRERKEQLAADHAVNGWLPRLMTAAETKEFDPPNPYTAALKRIR